MNRRTNQQNRALHLWFKLLAHDMEAQGLDMKLVLRPEIPITPTPELVKNHIWRPVQIAKFDKYSTADITTDELQKTYKDVDTFFLTKHKLNLPFPSKENLELLKKLTEEYGL